MKNLIKQTFENYGISLTELQIEQFEKYYNYLVEENEKFNLTAITEAGDVVVKHFIDSVLPNDKIKVNANVIDVGTGAGFPGVPLKILRPDLKITLLDSLNKRVEFLKKLCSFLDIDGVEFVHSRAEDFVKENREKFDYAVSRAVASLPTLSEYLMPYVKIGGQVIMYKGSKADEELAAGQKAVKTLGGKVREVTSYVLSEKDGVRKIIVIDKKNSTPSVYPRGKNLPKTKPIM